MKIAGMAAWAALAVVAMASCGDDDGNDRPGAGTGGAPTGGVFGTATGGAVAAGGGPSTGGIASGGSIATGGQGGVASGGASAGGAASGGASAGGAASGGASAGGAASGGASAGGAASGGTSAGGSGSGPFQLASPVVQDGGRIPARFRCAAPSPALDWSGGPTAQSYALVFQDVTPGVSNGFLHWVIYDLSPSTRSLPEGVPVGYQVASPAGAHQSRAWNGTVGFTGPCGGNNTYEMTIYALDVPALTELSESSTGAAARAAIEAHDVASTKLRILSSP